MSERSNLNENEHLIWDAITNIKAIFLFHHQIIVKPCRFPWQSLKAQIQGGSSVFLLARCNCPSVSGNQKKTPQHTTSLPAGFVWVPDRGWRPCSHPSPLLVAQCRAFCFVSAWFSIPFSAQLCFLLWNLVHCGLCANVLQRTVLSSNYACDQPPHEHTDVHRGGSDGGNLCGGWHGGSLCEDVQ